ncbi:hypothetical protein HDZ31DRAFT_79480 [Schizophyllum fasciatum]
MPYPQATNAFAEDDRYFSYMIQLEEGPGTSGVHIPYYVRDQEQPQDQPMSPVCLTVGTFSTLSHGSQGWSSDASTLSPWPLANQPMTIDPSQTWFGGQGQWPTDQASPSEYLSPSSDAPSPPAQALMQVSTAFNLETSPSPAHPPDCEVMSADDVVFYINSALLERASSTGFGHAYPAAGARVRVPEPADVLNLLLHAAYAAPLAAFAPPLDTLADAIARLPAYGLSAPAHVAPGAPLFEALRAHAARAPLRVYTLAAAHDLRALARLASAHLLGFPVHAMADAEARAVGAVYLKRLVALQHDRLAQLRVLLEQSQEFHPQTQACGFQAQRGLAREWSRVANEVSAEARPDASSSTLRQRLAAVKSETSCAACQKKLDERIWKAIVGWTMLPTAIQ